MHHKLTSISNGFYCYTWWAQLAPSEKYEGGSFDKIVD